jgi:hypothetical protein
VNGSPINEAPFEQFQHVDRKRSRRRIVQGAHLREQHEQEDLPLLIGGNGDLLVRLPTTCEVVILLPHALIVMLHKRKMSAASFGLMLIHVSLSLSAIIVVAPS